MVKFFRGKVGLKTIYKIKDKYIPFLTLQMLDLVKKKIDFINISGIWEENALKVLKTHILNVSNWFY